MDADVLDGFDSLFFLDRIDQGLALEEKEREDADALEAATRGAEDEELRKGLREEAQERNDEDQRLRERIDDGRIEVGGRLGDVEDGLDEEGRLRALADSDLTAAINGIDDYLDGDTFVVEGNVPDSTASVTVRHTGTAPGSNARLTLSTRAGGGDASVSFGQGGGPDWTMGVDNSDGDKFKISNAPTLGDFDVLALTTSGRVGVGTPNPVRKLHVAGTGDVHLRVESTDQAAAVDLAAADGNGYVGNQLGDFSILSGGQRAVTVKAGGNVGLGTATPLKRLHLADDGILLEGSNSNLQFLRGDNPHAAQIIQRTDLDDGLLFQTSSGGARFNDDSLFLQRGGRVGIGTTSPGATLGIHDKSGATSNPVLRLETRSDGGQALELEYSTIRKEWRLNPDAGSPGYNIAFARDGGETMMLWEQASGNVGIGTTSPAQKLDVNGAVRATALNLQHNGLGACDQSIRGHLQFVHGESDDSLYLCALQAGGYGWRAVSIG